MKDFSISQEIIDLFVNIQKEEDLKNRFIPISHRLAKKYADKCWNGKQKAWAMVFELYPELKEPTKSCTWTVGWDFVRTKDD